jgi:hypothetical protein
MFRVAYNNEGVAFFANLQKGNTQKIRQAVGLFEETTLTNNQRKETTNEPNHQ